MNPVALLLIIVGIALTVIGFRNHQDNLISAFAGKPVLNSTLK